MFRQYFWGKHGHISKSTNHPVYVFVYFHVALLYCFLCSPPAAVAHLYKVRSQFYWLCKEITKNVCSWWNVLLCREESSCSGLQNLHWNALSPAQCSLFSELMHVNRKMEEWVRWADRDTRGRSDVFILCFTRQHNQSKCFTLKVSRSPFKHTSYAVGTYCGKHDLGVIKGYNEPANHF